MDYTCRRCSSVFDPTNNQIKKSDFLCLPCNREHHKEYRKKRKDAGNPVKSGKMPLEYHRKYDKAYKTIERVISARRLSARNRRNNPGELEKIKCRRLTRSAIESGVLIKMPCEICGDIKVDAHHNDYKKPLEVIWFCRTHHVQFHAKAKGETK